jgi:Cu/Ag efflux protein CusF
MGLAMLKYGLGMPITEVVQCLWQRRMRWAPCLIATVVTLLLAGPGYVCAQDKSASTSGSAQVAKAVGVIKSIQADSVMVTAESGGEVAVTLTGSTKILRVPPGEKDLKNATALQAQDLQPGDRVLVRGQASAAGDGHTMVALSVIVMKQADVAAVHQRELDDWQKRGVGGLVTAVDAAAGTITISSGGIGAKRSIAVHVSKSTILRRYAPGSVKFDDAKPAPIEQIKAGDQFLAVGTRNPDGSELSAEEVVSGTFRNIVGTIKAIDAASNTLTVQDAIGKSAVVVQVSADSQMWKLPAEMAQRFAARLKGTPGGGSGEQSGASGQGQRHGTSDGQRSAPDAGGVAGTESQAGHGAGGNGPPDLQRMLSRLPNIKLADLQKGDAVYILATEGGSSDTVTSIKLVAGVEPILTAAPGATTLLSPWSLGASGGEGEGAQQ